MPKGGTLILRLCRLERDTARAAEASLELKLTSLNEKIACAQLRYLADYKKWKNYYAWSEEQDKHHRIKRNASNITRDERRALDQTHFADRMDGLRAMIPDVERFAEIPLELVEVETPRVGVRGLVKEPSTAAIMAASTVKAPRVAANKARDNGPPSSPSEFFAPSKTTTKVHNSSDTEDSQGQFHT